MAATWARGWGPGRDEAAAGAEPGEASQVSWPAESEMPDLSEGGRGDGKGRGEGLGRAGRLPGVEFRDRSLPVGMPRRGSRLFPGGSWPDSWYQREGERGWRPGEDGCSQGMAC